MTCAPAISSILTTDTTITSLLATYDGTPAVFPNQIPTLTQQNLPAIMYQGRDADRVVEVSGSNGPLWQLVTLFCIARTYDAVCQLANAVETEMVTKKGTINGLDVMGIFIDGDSESEEGQQDVGDSVTAHIKTLTFKVWFR